MSKDGRNLSNKDNKLSQRKNLPGPGEYNPSDPNKVAPK